MPAHITIRDGTPWWDSSDIWVVPGSDPNGSPGSPIAGMQAYLWAHVANTGNQDAPGTRVDFYWADPTAQITVGNATPIGSAFVDLDTDPAGQDVLCLVPWVPVVVNGGHECLLAVAHGPNDTNPIPDPLPTGYQFDPPAHDQVAQRNITVASAFRLSRAFAIAVHATQREEKRAELIVAFGGVLEARQLELLGLAKLDLKPARERVVRARLSLEPICGGQDDGKEMAPAEALVEGAEEGGSAGADVAGAASAAAGDEAGEAEPTPDQAACPAPSDAPPPGPGNLPDGMTPVPGGALAVHVPRGSSTVVYLGLDASRLQTGEYQLLHVLERSKDTILGGVSYVVIRTPQET